MRLDKYLKISRLIKRRTVAKEVCDKGKININGRVAKSSSDVKPGDILELNFGNKIIKIEVLETPANVMANLAKDLYNILAEQRLPTQSD